MEWNIYAPPYGSAPLEVSGSENIWANFWYKRDEAHSLNQKKNIISNTADRKRQSREEIKLLSTESIWLQKAIFALQKVETAREKLAKHRGEEESGFVLMHSADGSELEVEDFVEAIEMRIRYLLDEVKDRRNTMR